MSLRVNFVSVILLLQKSDDGVPMWEPNPESFTVSVSNPKKQTKFKGIKSFIAYEIVRSVSQLI